MRKFFTIAKATAFEIVDDPLSLLILISSSALAILGPALHYHQFGEPSRMARDAGFSALFICGILFVGFGSIRSLRRELESGTASVALSRDVGRGVFFLAKYFGSLLAYLHYASSLFLLTIIIIKGAEIGGSIALAKGDIARLYGPSFVIGTACVILPPFFAATLNKWANLRFASTSNVIMLGMLFTGAFFKFDLSLVLRVLPVALVAMLPAALVSAALLSFAVKFRINVSLSLGLLVFVLLIPFIGSYYLPETLAKGGSLSWKYVGFSFAAIAPLIAAHLFLGAALFARREI